MKAKHAIFALMYGVAVAIATWVLTIFHYKIIDGDYFDYRMTHDRSSAYGWWVTKEDDRYYWVRYSPGDWYICLYPQVECDFYKVRKEEVRIDFPDEKTRAEGNIKSKYVVLLRK